MGQDNKAPSASNEAATTTGTNCQPEEFDFTSDEKIPDNWPEEEFPGITKFAPAEPATSLQFDSGDLNLVNSLGNLATGALIDEIKAMHAISYRLTIEEEQEKLRGKILKVLLD